MDKRRSCLNCRSADHPVSAFPTLKQGVKAIGFSLEDEDASDIDREDFMRGLIAKSAPKCFFCKLKSHFKSDCQQSWDAVADIKQPRQEEAFSVVKASQAQLTMKKMQAVLEETTVLRPRFKTLKLTRKQRPEMP